MTKSKFVIVFDAIGTFITAFACGLAFSDGIYPVCIFFLIAWTLCILGVVKPLEDLQEEVRKGGFKLEGNYKIIPPVFPESSGDAKNCEIYVNKENP